MDNTKNSPETPPEFTSSEDDDCNLQELHSRPLLGLQLDMAEPLFAKLESKLAAAAPPPPEAESSRRKSRRREVLQYHDQPNSDEKASNFPISSVSVGAWKRVHTGRQGDLTAKIYFKTKKLVWEFLNGHLKSKMQFDWSSIIAIRATMLPNQDGVLEIELSNPPLFKREIEPTPKKHTDWENASDFTDGQAEIFRVHIATFPPGALDKHYEKLLQKDENLLELSKRPFPSQSSPYFNIGQEQQTLFFQQQHPRLHYPIDASSLQPPPHHPTPLNPQELGCLNFSPMDGIAYSRNNQQAMWENQSFDFLNNARFLNDDAIYMYRDHLVEPPSSSNDHHFFNEHPSMAEEFALFEDFNRLNVASTSYNNNLSDQDQVMTMVQNNAVINDHHHYNLMFPTPLPPPPPPLPHVQGCNHGGNQEVGYDRDLGDGSLAQVVYSSTHRVQDSPMCKCNAINVEIHEPPCMYSSKLQR